MIKTFLEAIVKAEAENCFTFGCNYIGTFLSKLKVKLFWYDKYRNFFYKLTIKDMEKECENESGKGAVIFKNDKDKIIIE